MLPPLASCKLTQGKYVMYGLKVAQSQSGSRLHCQTWINFPLSELLYTVVEYSYPNGSLAPRMPVSSMTCLEKEQSKRYSEYYKI